MIRPVVTKKVQAMQLVVLIVTAACTITTCLAQYPESVAQYPERTDECQPIESCSCYMDSIYYDDGDTWNATGNPCTQFRCDKGIVNFMSKDCEFKDTCKALDSVWSEGCFTYKCLITDPEIADIVYYRLLDGGCVDKGGNCWNVGDVFSQGCKTYECIIDDGCYTLNVVSEGCYTGQDCKPLNSFWDEGCRVYQCVRESGISRQKLVPDEVMLWPHADFGLFKPKTGCPLDTDEWSEGSRHHFAGADNFFSDPFDLFGSYEDGVMEYHFCVHTCYHTQLWVLRYQTYWEPGRYCILRNSGKCPKSFQQGYFEINSLTLNTTKTGTLPDGTFNITNSTGLHVCCRNDGNPSEPILLPKEIPFVLLMADEENTCQEVRGMSYSIEFLGFAKAEGGLSVPMNGSLPEIKDDNTTTMVFFCHYTPIGCGCLTKSGMFVGAKRKFTESCVTVECTFADDVHSLRVNDGGCLVDNTCRSESSIWTVTSGEACQNYTCVREGNDTDFRFVEKELDIGCRYEDICYPLGHNITEGCTISHCNDDDVDEPKFLKKLEKGCVDDGKCRPDGFKKQLDDCSWNKCEYNASFGKLKFKFSNGACKDSVSSICFDEGTHWNGVHNGHCQKFECVKTGNTYSPKMVGHMCIDSSGQCQDVGSKGFSAKVNGKLWHECTCTRDKGKSVTETCRWYD